jgi:hypothetical protein
MSVEIRQVYADESDRRVVSTHPTHVHHAHVHHNKTIAHQLLWSRYRAASNVNNPSPIQTRSNEVGFVFAIQPSHTIPAIKTTSLVTRDNRIASAGVVSIKPSQITTMTIARPFAHDFRYRQTIGCAANASTTSTTHVAKRRCESTSKMLTSLHAQRPTAAAANSSRPCESRA